MGKVVVDMAVSLDGYIAGANDDDGGLHNWYFDESDKENQVIISQLIDATGAIIFGRRSYELGNQYDGYVDNPYKVPHYVITHQAPEQSANGDTEFIFVTNGIESAIKQAQMRVGDKAVIIGGGASIIKQSIKAGLIDEIHLHLVPIMLGQGIRLFDEIPLTLKQTHVIVTDSVTHLYYEVT